MKAICPTYKDKCKRGRQASAPCSQVRLQRAAVDCLSGTGFLRCRSDEVSGCEFVLQIRIVDRCRNKAGQPEEGLLDKHRQQKLPSPRTPAIALADGGLSQ